MAPTRSSARAASTRLFMVLITGLLAAGVFSGALSAASAEDSVGPSPTAGETAPTAPAPTTEVPPTPPPSPSTPPPGDNKSTEMPQIVAQSLQGSTSKVSPKSVYDQSAPQTPLNASSLRLTAQGATPGATISNDGLSARSADGSSFSVDASAGAISASPSRTFSGSLTLGFTALNGAGDTVTGSARFKVAPTPTPQPDTATTNQGKTVSITPLINDWPNNDGGSPLGVGSLQLRDGGSVTTSLTVSGSGSYRVDASANTISFTPVNSAKGPQKPVSYQFTDLAGNVYSSTITVTVVAQEPVARDDTAKTNQGEPVSVDVLGNDSPGTPEAPLDVNSVVFAPAQGQLNANGKQLNVPGQGVFVIDGPRVTFTPEKALRESVDVRYTVSDALGNQTSATLAITVAPVNVTALDDYVVANPGRTIVMNPLSNDSPGAPSAPLDPASAELDPEQSGGNVGDGGKSLTVPGQGTYVFDQRGALSFTPAQSFTGAASGVGYSIADSNGTRGRAKIFVSLTAPAAPTIIRSSVDGQALSFQTQVPMDSYFLNADGLATTRLVLPQGTFVVDANGRVTFTPAPGFSGKVPSVTLFGKDQQGRFISQLLELSSSVHAATPPSSAQGGEASSEQPEAEQPSQPNAANLEIQPLPSILLVAAFLAALALMILVMRRSSRKNSQ